MHTDVSSCDTLDRMLTKISTRWQTVIPKEAREELEIGPDWSLSWEVRDGLLLVVPIPPDPVRASLGMFKSETSVVDELLAERRRDREREEKKFREPEERLRRRREEEDH